MWYQSTLGQRSTSDFMTISSDLRPYVLDIWVAWNYLVQWEMNLFPPLKGLLHLYQVKSGHTESEWTMFISSTTHPAARSCGQKTVSVRRGSNPRMHLWTSVLKNGAKKCSWRALLIQLRGTGEPEGGAAKAVTEVEAWAIEVFGVRDVLADHLVPLKGEMKPCINSAKQVPVSVNLYSGYFEVMDGALWQTPEPSGHALPSDGSSQNP